MDINDCVGIKWKFH